MKLIQKVLFTTSIMISGGLAFATAGLALDCSCDQSTDGSDTVVEVTSDTGVELTLRFAANPVTRQTKLAFLCANPAIKVTLAKLWMPGHGHGSSPTTLVPVTDTCTRVERVNFVMLGEWEIQTTLEGGGKGTFPFEVVAAN